MTTREPAPAVYLAAVLDGETPPGGVTMSAYRCAIDAESLVRLGKRASKIAVDRCNGIQRWNANLVAMLAIVASIAVIAIVTAPMVTP